MRRATRTLLLAMLVLASACDSSTEPKVPDLTGFWSGLTVFSYDPSCTLETCTYSSRMMIFQTGNTVEGWYSVRGDETPLVGRVKGDTLMVLINSAQVTFVGAVKFSILEGSEILYAQNNGFTLQFVKER